MRKILGFNLNLFVFNIEAGDLLEIFFLSAICSLLIIRAFLKITGYPQLGGGQFHIAHMLWGGLFMMLALVIAMVFLNKEAKKLAAFLGGIGFGAFIDELGKFITSDNNYFYQPAIALIYVVFILFFFAMRLGEKLIRLSDKDYAVNALEITKEVVLHDLDEQERKKALFFLSKSSTKSPVVTPLRKMLSEIKPQPSAIPDLLSVIRNFLYKNYRKLVRNKWFASILVLLFVGSSLLGLVAGGFQFTPKMAFADWGRLISSLISGALVLGGVYYWHQHKRLSAYEMFKRAVLISIFLTQFFLFYEEQLSAIFVLFINIAVLTACQYFIEQEKFVLKEKNHY